jgi:hypothetical protein
MTNLGRRLRAAADGLFGAEDQPEVPEEAAPAPPLSVRRFRFAGAEYVNLRQNSAHNFAARQALVHYPSGAVYSFIPKNGCTTLRYSLALAHGMIDGPEDFVWIHENNPTFAADLRDLITTPYSFVILRCPHARLASVFLDKIVGRTPEAWQLRKLAGEELKLGDLTFRTFAEMVKLPRNRKANPHWREQTDFLVYDDYDGWFQLEAFAEAAQQIEARTGLVLHDTRGMMRHGTDQYSLESAECFADTSLDDIAAMRREGRSPAHKALYDPDLITTVSAMYKTDIELYRDHFGAGGLLFPDSAG